MELREFFKVYFCSAVSRGRYYSVLLKPDIHCGGLSFGSEILLSQGCKYAVIPPPLEKHRWPGRAKMLCYFAWPSEMGKDEVGSTPAYHSKGTSLQMLLVVHRTPGKGAALGQQNSRGIYHVWAGPWWWCRWCQSPGHWAARHAGLSWRSAACLPGAPTPGNWSPAGGSCHSAGRGTAGKGWLECEQWCPDGNRLAREKRRSRRVFWNFLHILPWLSACRNGCGSFCCIPQTQFPACRTDFVL